MPKNTTQTLTPVWTEITANNVTSITVQNRGPDDVELMGTVGAVVPAISVSGMLVGKGEAIINRAMTDLFPGVSGANRVYGRTRLAIPNNGATVFVSHA